MRRNEQQAEADHGNPLPWSGSTQHPDGNAVAEEALVVDRLVRSRRRTVSLVVDEQAALVVRAPMKMPLRDIEQILRQKEDWIRKHQAQMRIRLLQRPERKYADGEGFLWLGRTLRLHTQAHARGVRREDGLLILPEGDSEISAQRIARWYREEARTVISERVRVWAALMGLPVDRITLTNAVRRWGACSGRANLSFATRLVMAPLEVIDYVVVHELCHVVHKNHGPQFWELVAEQMPDYALHRKWLAEYAQGMVF